MTVDQWAGQAISGLISFLSLCLVGALKLYIGRLVSRLDGLDAEVKDLKKERQCKWSEHIAGQQQRDIEIEKRCTRAELLIEVLYHNTIGNSNKQNDVAHMKAILDGNS